MTRSLRSSRRTSTTRSATGRTAKDQAEDQAIARRRKPLDWHYDQHGALPGCAPCAELYLSPVLAEAVATCALDRSNPDDDPTDMARRVVEHYHATGHKEGP